MTPKELAADLRSRINPIYAEQLGTESYERRLCAEAIEALLVERAELLADAETNDILLGAAQDAAQRLAAALEVQTKAADHWIGEACRDHNELDKLKHQKPVAWVEVIDRHDGPYNFKGQELLDSGKHNLYLAAGATP